MFRLHRKSCILTFKATHTFVSCFVFSFLYLAILLSEVSNNIVCALDNSTNSSNPDDTIIVVNNKSIDIDCKLEPIYAAGNTSDVKLIAVIYLTVVFVISLNESVFETVLPVLGGDQVGGFFFILNNI